MSKGRQLRVGLENLRGEFLPRGTCDQSLAGKVKEERVIVVELVEDCALVWSDEPLPVVGTEMYNRYMWM